MIKYQNDNHYRGNSQHTIIITITIIIITIIILIRFTLKHLKDFGFGRAGLEGVIQGEVMS